ncbi:MAG: DHHA1 domain-containing protein, partial [Rudaea sp.]
REVRSLRTEMLPLRAKQMVQGAIQTGRFKLVTAIYREPELADLRPLGSLLAQEPGVIAVLANYDGKKVSMAVACAQDAGVKANELLGRLLARIGGRGGGDAGLAMGGGGAAPGQLEDLFAAVRSGELFAS